MSGTLRLGTSAFTAAGWPGTFYPEGLPPAEYLSYYAQHFDAVEVDSTYYRIPTLAMTRGWHAKTPKRFLFALKMVQAVTHEKVLVDCESEFKAFLNAADALGEKLGPLLFQFPYFNKKAFATVDEFLERLAPFLKKLPKGYRFAVETRNKNWLVPKFIELLRERGVALALIDHPWMPRPKEILAKFDPVTADFSYIRWLGDRKGIEEKTQHWDRVIQNREQEMETWIPAIDRLLERRLRVYAYFNNHYAGFAPGSIALFHEIWERMHSP